MNCVSCDICVYSSTTFGLCFFPGVVLSSRVSGACPVTTDLIMRVNMRTKATTATTYVSSVAVQGTAVPVPYSRRTSVSSVEVPVPYR